MNTAFKPANILIPNCEDMTKWAVVACDQYTSEPEYWDETCKIVGDAPSTLNIILPELYLEEPDVDERIEKIHQNMDGYLNGGLFKEYKDAMLYIERVQNDGKVRAGLIGKIDLEEYDVAKGTASAVRPTEATVIERIPPRMKVRNGASLESPHIMILIDDGEKSVIEPIKKDSLKKVYDTALMQKGGSVCGYLLPESEQKRITAALCALGDKEKFNAKYGLENEPALVYAMGDGNHSLATAKAFYEKLKAENPDADLSEHPTRYALVEIVNLHSPALEFEAIYRLVYGVDCGHLAQAMTAELGLSDCCTTEEQDFTLITPNGDKALYIGKPSSSLTVGTVQNFLDRYLKENGGQIDYIHGKETLRELVARHNGMGFIFRDMHKDELFPTVIKDGALPRKTFSMGHAEDKRFYIECRKIVKS